MEGKVRKDELGEENKWSGSIYRLRYGGELRNELRKERRAFNSSCTRNLLLPAHYSCPLGAEREREREKHVLKQSS